MRGHGLRAAGRPAAASRCRRRVRRTRCTWASRPRRRCCRPSSLRITSTSGWRASSRRRRRRCGRGPRRRARAVRRCSSSGSSPAAGGARVARADQRTDVALDRPKPRDTMPGVAMPRAAVDAARAWWASCRRRRRSGCRPPPTGTADASRAAAPVRSPGWRSAATAPYSADTGQQSARQRPRAATPPAVCRSDGHGDRPAPSQLPALGRLGGEGEARQAGAAGRVHHGRPRDWWAAVASAEMMTHGRPCCHPVPRRARRRAASTLRAVTGLAVDGVAAVGGHGDDDLARVVARPIGVGRRAA